MTLHISLSEIVKIFNARLKLIGENILSVSMFSADLGSG